MKQFAARIELPDGYHCPSGLFDALEDAQTWVEQEMEQLVSAAHGE